MMIKQRGKNVHEWKCYWPVTTVGNYSELRMIDIGKHNHSAIKFHTAIDIYAKCTLQTPKGNKKNKLKKTHTHI